MNLLYLKYFCDAAKAASISHSAKLNFVTQSAISQAIHKLEKELGKELVVHRQNRFKITHEGEIVLEKSRAIFAAIEELKMTIQANAGEIAGKIEFAAMHSFALAVLPRKIKELKRRFPKLAVNFRLGHTDLMKDWVKKGIIDCGIVLDNEDFSGFQTHELYKGQYRLYISKKVKDTNLAFITSEDLMETHLLKKAYKKKMGKELPVLMQVSSWEVIAKLTEEGLGIGFFPDYVALSKTGLQEYSIGLAPIYYKVFAIFQEKTRLTPVMEAFLEVFLKEV